MTIDKAQAHIQTAKDMIHGSNETSSLKQARAIFNRVKAELAEINEDATLSALGKAQKGREARERGAVDLAKMVRKFRQAVDAELDKAQREARAIIEKPDVKPPQTLIDGFMQQYNEYKMELAVFGTRAHADKIVKLMETVDDPYFANVLKSDFAAYGPAVRGHIDPIRFRDLYERVKRIAETDARASAKAALDEIEALRKASPVSHLIDLGVASALGDTYRGVVHDYESFLRQRGE